MKNFIKHYLGKGKQVGELQIIKVTVKLEDLQKYAYQYDNVQFVTFEIAKMKTPDNFGRDYTAYVSVLQESTGPKEEVPETVASTVDTASEEQSVAVEEEIPF
ncbi:MAG: hypothetical protein M0Q53_07400 [Prolixibacteraceae bacterium]|jgi:hypothetical protein|nr:hypothetical protein [Prolixibacteraceae bacterium]